jgi:uncharacterized protein with von Willebrand factor type A (vWA) domain
MPIDLRKYDGRYVEIMYGSLKIMGKLCLGEEEAMIKEFCIGRTFDVTDYIKGYVDGQLGDSIVINERNINFLRDVTEEIYEYLLQKLVDLEKIKKETEAQISMEWDLREGKLESCQREMEKLQQLQKDIEQIKAAEKKKEIPKKRLPFIYYS